VTNPEYRSGKVLLMPYQDTDLDMLALTLVDLRATTEAMRRSVTNAQASVEHYRHTRSSDRLTDIADCLTHLRREAGVALESTRHAEQSIGVLIAQPRTES
jgi:hypothetical protein